MGYRQLLPPPRPPVPARLHSLIPAAVKAQSRVQPPAAQDSKRKSITLGDDQIINLSIRPDVLSAVPRLTNYRPKIVSKGCRCSHKSQNAKSRIDALRSLKEVLQHLSNDEIIKLKRVLMVQEILFYVRTSAGVEKRTL